MFVDHFARSGGGGSSSGGGGSSGGAGSLLFAIGYFPMRSLGKIFRKSNNVLLGSFVLWPITLIIFGVLTIYLGLYGFIIGLGAVSGTGGGLYGWFAKLLKMSKRTQNDLRLAASTDPAWNEQTLLASTADIFYKFQKDWTNFNIDSIKTYTTPYYQHHTALMLQALKLAKRKNNMSEVKILTQNITAMSNPDGVDGDMVTVGFQAEANDSLIDESTGEVLHTDKNSFIEYWTFVRDSKGWLLDHIDQETANLYASSETLKEFSREHNYFYSLDWGWLLLPKRGQLFGSGKFGVSDINNHIIGNYKDSLIQLYTYQPNPSADRNARQFYLIAQANVQKSYGNIVVRRKKFLQNFRIKDLQKIQTEWTSFNKNYEVFASSAEGATSFELLEPTFMEKLNALSFEVNIEVVDNVVYLYSKEKAVNAEHYAEMLGILHEAYSYMKK